ncbi:hypothetical protein P4O66_014336, partial [Electrophorus voltai]
FEEDILIVSEGRMAPFTHDFKKAQQRMPAIPVHIHYVNFTWQVTDQAEYFYEFQTLRSFDKDIMDDPTVNVPRLGSVPHKASGSVSYLHVIAHMINGFACVVVQVGFPCRGDQDGVAAFEVTILVMDGGGNIVLRTPHNAIFFKSCQRAKCPGGCRNGGYCNERQVCECHDGFYGTQCEKALCSPRCMNGGLCMSPGLCGCPPGYYGASCEKANCSTTCFNGGTCFHPGKCVCPTGFEGSHCEKSEYKQTSHKAMLACAEQESRSMKLPRNSTKLILALRSSVGSGKCRQPCRNGGKCMGKNKCKCSKGYHGDLCSKGYRGGSSTIPRPSRPRPKPHTTSERELRVASDTNRPSDTNYVV